ncbi:MAG: hypothetical protein ACLFVK_03945 [Dehalococcoidia bacterium]
MARLSLSGRDPEQEAREINDAGEVVRWYQNFIYAKIMRALEGKLQEPSLDLQGMPADSDGSAKIALIAIDHSTAAWANLLGHFPEKQDDTLELLVHLHRLRRAFEAVFPDARAFIRPGFDEGEIRIDESIESER